jgi:hypothetical protein
MKVPVIKKIIETYNLTELNKAQESLENEQMPEIEIEGEDEGEQLTHVLAGIWILEQVEANNTDIKTELRNYTQRVRNSIS